jgi:hypothetical protein
MTAKPEQLLTLEEVLDLIIEQEQDGTFLVDHQLSPAEMIALYNSLEPEVGYDHEVIIDNVPAADYDLPGYPTEMLGLIAVTMFGSSRRVD